MSDAIDRSNRRRAHAHATPYTGRAAVAPRRCAWVLAALAVWVAMPVQAGARARLDAFLHELATYRADFEQRLYDEDHALLETARGTVAIARPGRFRWDYQTPYKQLIVTDGETLWVYDDDLAQVTINPLDHTAANSPAQLLGRDLDIDAHYDVTEEGEMDGLAWLRLVPKGSGDQYAAVQMGFDTGGIKGMRLQDNLGQITEIVFTNPARNTHIDDALFEFVPPAGADIVHGSEL